MVLVLMMLIKGSLGQVSAANTAVSGDGVANFDALSTRTVTVTAKDSGSANVGSGGDLFYIQISNQCTKASNFECTVGGGADNTIASPIWALMTDNNDGTYTYTWTPDNEGTLSIVVVYMNRFSILSNFYHTSNLAGAIASTNYSSTINYNWTTYNVTLTQSDTVSAKFDSYVRGPVTGTVTLYMYTEDYAALSVDGTSKFNHFSSTCACEYTTTVSMTAGNYYRIEASWGETTGEAVVKLYWSYSGQAKTIIPATSWFYPEYVGSSPYTVTVSCPTGYSGTNSSNPNVCSEICGDGKRIGNEVCDDSNTVGSPVDGCSADCRSIDAGWVCSGGNPTTADSCTECADGFYQNDATTPTVCVTRCGDGKEAGTEKCDDSNTANGDGCKGDCTTVEAGWVCSGGSPTAADTCTECAAGFYQDSGTNPENCVTQCGDGLEAGTEKCDDGNTVGSPVDGCNAGCTSVDAGWVCSGGSPTSVDTCTKCADGFYQNDAANPESCVTTCGDGVRAGTEKCDDNNVVGSPIDGCSADCSAIDAGWVCSGGTPTTVDTCVECAPGYHQNDPVTPTVCVTVCGDGFKAGSEICDDGNTASGDGCAADCLSIETDWACNGGTPTTRDVCEYCGIGLVLDSGSSPTKCNTVCGDGRKMGDEICDDGNTDNDDGCDSACNFESSFICTGGNFTTPDTCITCHSNYVPNDSHSKCRTKTVKASTITFSLFYIIFVGVGILFCFITLITSNSFYLSIFAMINQCQMFLLFPLIGSFSSESVIEFSRFIDIFLGGFSWITQYIIPIVFDPAEEYDFAQNQWYLYLIGIESSSSIFNISGGIFILTCLGILHGIVYLLNDVSLDLKGDTRCNKLMHRFINWLTCSAYIRLYLYTYMFICLISINELKNTSNRLNYSTSYTFAGLLLLFIISSTIMMAYHCLKYESDPESLSQKKVQELFNALKNTKMARLYYPLFCIRRLLLVGGVLVLEHMDGKIRLGWFGVINLIYFVYFIAVRPFAKVKENLFELFNEATVVLLTGFLVVKYNSGNWGNGENTIFFAIVMLNAVVYMFTSFGGFLSGLMSDLEEKEKTQAANKGPIKSNRRTRVVEYPAETKNRVIEAPAQPVQEMSRAMNDRTTTDLSKLDKSAAGLEPMTKNDFKSKGLNIYGMS